MTKHGHNAHRKQRVCAVELLPRHTLRVAALVQVAQLHIAHTTGTPYCLVVEGRAELAAHSGNSSSGKLLGTTACGSKRPSGTHWPLPSRLLTGTFIGGARSALARGRTAR